ncbi:magnesium transporter [Tessaracoccus rhinocerotis]|uniref:Magnesium transporter MgtE n=1 Tax=Tessaracoccus rhinocerotis TaxID=1689449 RepID=A0A553K0D1_9ACTN|nr:magnesium transporter [Tessaracoccus rhinocerotis]TRY18166.1 magnesium transporter [Tessaracoccus rhinocerotis]
MEVQSVLEPEEFERTLAARDLTRAQELLARASTGDVVDELDRLQASESAVAFRLLPKDRALEVFELLDPASQGDLVRVLRTDETAAVFEPMDPDDRVTLLDELPAGIATRLMSGLSDDERLLTTTVLGYPKRSIGRQMSPEVAVVHGEQDVATALAHVRDVVDDSETIYTICVTDNTRRLLGVVSLRDLISAAPTTLVAELISPADTADATEPAEDAARRCAERRHLALPVVDSEERLVGILTVDDALRIIEEAESEDLARQGGAEPLRRHYLSTPIIRIVRSRVVWLLVLAIGASLTVQVLEVFEETIGKLVVLSVFIPLLIGTGGNTGNQAATTVTRALALGEVRPRDAMKVLGRELATGATLGLVMGSLGFAITSLIYDVGIGSVIGLTLLVMCALAATVGGLMPLLAKAVRADPAVFSNPFISTFVDATGLVVYFLIAKLILGI